MARAASQLLGPHRASSVPEVLDRLGALQAQDLAATALAVRARSSGLRAADLDLDGPAYVRTWLMRGTLHLIAADDAGWMLGLLGPINRAKGARRRAQLGLTDALCAEAVPALSEVLADGPLGRDEIVARLASLGVVIGPGQAAPHLLAYAASLGVLCLGPERTRAKPTYRLLDAPSPLTRDAALTELARRYLRGHHPADPTDFAAWSGLPARDARAAFTALSVPPVSTVRGSVRLVGHFDPYLLGYADKTAVVPPEFVARVRTGGGFVTPTVLVAGKAVATWRRTGGTLTITPFRSLPTEVLTAVEHEVTDLARFLGTALTL